MQFGLNLQFLTRNSHFTNLPCSTTNLLTVEADRIYVALNIFGVSRTIALDRIEDTTGFFHKIKFYIVYGKMYFLIDWFLSRRRLWVAYEYKSYYKWIINYGMRQNSILIHPSFYFFYFNFFPGDVLGKIAIWVDRIALNSLCDKPSDWSYEL